MSAQEEHWLTSLFLRETTLFAHYFVVWTHFRKMDLRVRIFMKFKFGRKNWLRFVS